MPNRSLAEKWLELASNEFGAARILYDNEHSPDTIGIHLQQSIEKTLKSILAFYNMRIPKTHDLIELYVYIEQFYTLNTNEQDLIGIASDFYSENRYPGVFHSLPTKEEIVELLKFSDKIFKDICSLLGIRI